MPNADIPEQPLGEGRFRVFIEDEAGKVDINKANELQLKKVFEYFGLEGDSIVNAIVDWRQKDGGQFHKGKSDAEDYYRSLPEPYEVKHGDFDSIEELMRVKGISADLFYGGLRDMVTVYSKQTSVTLSAASEKVKKALAGFSEESGGKGEKRSKPGNPGMLNKTAKSVYTLRCYGKSDDSPVISGIGAVVEFDRNLKNGYRVLQWMEGIGEDYF
jgi:hypothetical protein